MIAHFLCACASFSWILESSMVSLLLFGEYPYPAEDQSN